jgi:hypothetical protein
VAKRSESAERHQPTPKRTTRACAPQHVACRQKRGVKRRATLRWCGSREPAFALSGLNRTKARKGKKLRGTILTEETMPKEIPIELIRATIKLDDAQVIAIAAAILWSQDSARRVTAQECVRAAKQLLYAARIELTKEPL